MCSSLLQKRGHSQKTPSNVFLNLFIRKIVNFLVPCWFYIRSFLLLLSLSKTSESRFRLFLSASSLLNPSQIPYNSLGIFAEENPKHINVYLHSIGVPTLQGTEEGQRKEKKKRKRIWYESKKLMTLKKAEKPIPIDSFYYA